MKILPRAKALFLAAALLGNAQAMEIYKFDKMANEDQDEYVADLIIGAQKVLIDDGQPDVAEKVHKLFTTKLAGDTVSLGMVEFDRNLDRARVADLKRVVAEPNAVRIEVEHALLVTLKKNDIILPKSFMHVCDNFKPKHPAQKP